MAGTCFMGLAVHAGKAGPVQAIDSLKSLPTLFMNLMLLGIGVSWQQWIGVALSIGGAAIVGLSK